jgi:hypothetical protein
LSFPPEPWPPILAAPIRRIYEADPLVCPPFRDADPMWIITFMTELRVIQEILQHLAAKAGD